MKNSITLLAAMLAFFAGGTLAADDSNPKTKTEQRERGSDDARKLSPQERDKRREEFKKLSPEERAAKRKEIKGRLEKRVGELRSKATNGTLNAEEKRELTRREQILKRFDQPARPAEDKR